MKHIFFWLFIFIAPVSYSQEVRIVNFAQLEKELKDSSDTLKVVNFWATWCAPCIAEMPWFVQAQEEYKNKKVKFIYVSLDFSKNIENVKKLALKKGLKGEWLLLKDDPNSYVTKIDPGWEGQIPITMLLGTDGNYIVHDSQFADFNELNTFIKDHLN
jgi:thiol-disulfide isomerase/thioredoxin